MKTIYKMTTIAIIGLIMNMNTSVAQEPNTRESIRKQYVNNNVPGLKYGPPSQQKRSIQSVESKQNTTGNIRDILFTGGVPANKSQTSKTNKNVLARASNTKLTSDEKTPEPQKDKQEIKNIVPSQGDMKEPVETTPKTAPTKADSKQKEKG